MRDRIKQVRLINTSDSDIATAFLSDTSASATVTWKPLVSQIVKQKGITSLFNSSQIPGEILDLTVVRTEVLNRPDGSGQRFAKALAGAWYEMMARMSAPGPEADKVLTAIAGGSRGHARVLQRTAQHHQDVLHAAVSRGVWRVGRI